MKKSHPAFGVRDMMAFLQAARDSSFTLAGEQLGMTPSAVSKAISRLEADLGATLLRRSPRSVTLTAEGSRFVEEGERLLVAMERARNVVADRTDMPRRKLRVALPIHFGRTEITPSLPLFAERYPSIDLEYLLISNGQIDLIEHEIDVALLVGGVKTSDTRLVSRKISAFDMVLCAAPSYLDQFGRPDSITGLDFHRTLGAFDEDTHEILPWRFRPGPHPVLHSPKFNMVSNSIEVLLSMAVAGSGVAAVPIYLASEPIKLGRLQTILPQHPLEPSSAEIIYLRGRSADPEVIDFVAMLLDAVERRSGGIQP